MNETTTIHLSLEDLIDKITYHVQNHIPLSLVRIGDGEAQLLALNSIATVEEVQHHPYFWPERDFIPKPTDPHISEIRDDMIWAIHNTDIVAINNYNDKWLWVREDLKRPLQDRVFAALRIVPAITCDQGCNRVIPIMPWFWYSMKDKRILVINGHGQKSADVIKRRFGHWGIKEVYHVHFGCYEDAKPALEAAKKIDFDIALVSAAFYGKRLTVELAKYKEVVSLDFGSTIDSILC